MPFSCLCSFPLQRDSRVLHSSHSWLVPDSSMRGTPPPTIDAPTHQHAQDTGAYVSIRNPSVRWCPDGGICTSPADAAAALFATASPCVGGVCAAPPTGSGVMEQSMGCRSVVSALGASDMVCVRRASERMRARISLRRLCKSIRVSYAIGLQSIVWYKEIR